MKANIDNMKKYISVNEITFYKTDNSYNYYHMFRLDREFIKNFIPSLDDDYIYSMEAIVSINTKSDEPYLSLCPKILITNKSDYKIIHNYLYGQYELS
jgi:hypothetical protein